jgi:hypothetical protein
VNDDRPLIGGPLMGYLYTLPGRARAGRERPILLKAACPCGSWHTHGAGTVERPADYPAGTVTKRAGHCRKYEYRAVEVQPEAFDPAWETRVGRLSAAYRRAA